MIEYGRGPSKLTDLATVLRVADLHNGGRKTGGSLAVTPVGPQAP